MWPTFAHDFLSLTLTLALRVVRALFFLVVSSYTENQKRAQYGTGKVRCNDDKPCSECWLVHCSTLRWLSFLFRLLTAFLL